MKTVIMAGGKGTRIASVDASIPKPMIPVCGKPVLEHQIANLKACGLTDITLVIGHLGHVIQDHFGDGRHHGVSITYFVEDQPLGTAGALYHMPQLTDDFLLMNGDIITGMDFNRLISFHREHHALATLAAHPNSHPYDSALLITETLPPPQPGALPTSTHRVVGWLNKEDPRQYYKNRVNAGIQVISPQLLAGRERIAGAGTKVDLDRDVLKPAIATGRIFAYDTPEYIKDMGTPDRYHEAERDMACGNVERRNLRNPQRAVFLDRDGTVNTYKGFLTRADDLELIPSAAEAIRMINRSGYLAVIVSNQPVIARGETTFQELQAIHDKLETLLGQEGAYVDAIYYCPHHPDKGFPGEQPDYKTICSCRKPKPGLLLQAAADWNIDLAQSYMIGDSPRDTEAGQAAGCRQSLLIPTNQEGALLTAVTQLLLTVAQ